MSEEKGTAAKPAAKKEEKGTAAKPAARSSNASAKKKMKIKITAPVSGKYLLPFNIGQVVSININQAKELIDNKVAEKA